jgi:hypothetical protein
MAPPLYLRLISTVLNTLVFTCGLRNVISPGTPLPFVPGDEAFLYHVHGFYRGEKTTMVLKLLGCFMCMASGTKLLTVNTAIEGTFLRR